MCTVFSLTLTNIASSLVFLFSVYTVVPNNTPPFTLDPPRSPQPIVNASDFVSRHYPGPAACLHPHRLFYTTHILRNFAYISFRVSLFRSPRPDFRLHAPIQAQRPHRPRASGCRVFQHLFSRNLGVRVFTPLISPSLARTSYLPSHIFAPNPTPSSHALPFANACPNQAPQIICVGRLFGDLQRRWVCINRALGFRACPSLGPSHYFPLAIEASHPFPNSISKTSFVFHTRRFASSLISLFPTIRHYCSLWRSHWGKATWYSRLPRFGTSTN